VTLMLGSAALAEAPVTSPRPEPRPGTVVVASSSAGASRLAPILSLRPMPRPVALAAAAPVAPVRATIAPALVSAALVPTASVPRDPINALIQALSPAVATTAVLIDATVLAVARSLRPEPRPEDLVVPVAAVAAPRIASARGSVCGVPEIKGEAIADIPGRIAGCGVDDPVRVTSVSGVALAQSPTIDCTTAKALNDWVREGVIPAVGRTGGGVARINVIAHYSCRSRNNQPGAKISEHGKGHAIDIAGITLANGKTLTVLDDWRGGGAQARIIQAMHRTACGPFGTVLGPNSDRFHRDHLHVDTARYRGGAYCR
jgi:hypothetical protein